MKSMKTDKIYHRDAVGDLINVRFKAPIGSGLVRFFQVRENLAVQAAEIILKNYSRIVRFMTN